MNRAGLKSYFRQIREPAKKRKIITFLLCLFCSAIFWLFIKLSSENQALLSQPIAITTLPAETVVFAQSDAEVRYQVQTTGARLFASMFFARPDTLRIPASSLPRIIREGSALHVATSLFLSELLDQQFDAGVRVHSIRPDTVFFQLDNRKEKKVPVQLQADISFQRRFGLYGEISLSPDSLLISGPASIIDTLTVIQSDMVVLSQLSETKEIEVNVPPPIEHPALRLNPEKISLIVPVAEFTEARVEVPLDIVCEDEYTTFDPGQLRLFPNRVSLVFLVALKDYHRIDPDLFHVYVDCAELPLRPTQLGVSIGRVPDFVLNQSVTPAMVDYLIMN